MEMKSREIEKTDTLKASVAVLEESICPRESSKINLRVQLSLSLSSGVKVLENCRGLQWSVTYLVTHRRWNQGGWGH